MSNSITISAFEWVPDFAKGQVRDLVVRWALEELELPYDTYLLNAAAARDETYVSWQPFDQVPAYRDDEVEMFESGAILIYLAEKHGGLMPTEAAARARVLSWSIATLNSVEHALRPIALYPLFHGEKDWCNSAVASLLPMAEQRLRRVSQALGESEWLAGDFSIADIQMIFVLRSFGGELINDFPNLLAYRERGLARPAFQRALQAQLDDFTAEPAS